MYQRYDELSMRILNGMKVEGKGKSTVSTTRTSIRKFREYMQGRELPYTPEFAARWLEKEIRPFCSHEVYKQIRFVHYRIAILFDSGQNLRELFYKDLQSDYDRFLHTTGQNRNALAVSKLVQAPSCFVRSNPVLIPYPVFRIKVVQTTIRGTVLSLA